MSQKKIVPKLKLYFRCTIWKDNFFNCLFNILIYTKEVYWALSTFYWITSVVFTLKMSFLGDLSPLVKHLQEKCLPCGSLLNLSYSLTLSLMFLFWAFDYDYHNFEQQFCTCKGCLYSAITFSVLWIKNEQLFARRVYKIWIVFNIIIN